jgi:hypothetical protein
MRSWLPFWMGAALGQAARLIFPDSVCLVLMVLGAASFVAVMEGER